MKFKTLINNQTRRFNKFEVLPFVGINEMFVFLERAYAIA